MKTFSIGAALVVAVVACAASAGSILLRNDGWVGWIVAALIFVIELLLWNAGMAPGARWPVCSVSYYLCKVALYTFAAQVLWFVADGAGMAFVAAVFLTEFLQRGARTQHVTVSTTTDVVSRVGGPAA